MAPSAPTLAAPGTTAAAPAAEQIAALRGAVRRFIGARVRNAATADDLTQDVFLKVMRQLEHVRDPQRIAGWIFSIARHEIADHFRRAKPTAEFHEHDAPAIPALAEIADREEEKLRQELNTYIRGVVDSLPAPYREALHLTEYQGMSQVALAGQIGLSVSAAKSRVQRARAMVKAIIERCCQFDVDRYGQVVACRSRKRGCSPSTRCDPGA